MLILVLIVSSLLGISTENERPIWCKDLSQSAQTCNPPEPPDPRCQLTWEQHCNLWIDMDEATAMAHEAEVCIDVLSEILDLADSVLPRRKD